MPAAQQGCSPGQTPPATHKGTGRSSRMESTVIHWRGRQRLLQGDSAPACSVAASQAALAARLYCATQRRDGCRRQADPIGAHVSDVPCTGGGTAGIPYKLSVGPTKCWQREQPAHIAAVEGSPDSYSCCASCIVRLAPAGQERHRSAALVVYEGSGGSFSIRTMPTAVAARAWVTLTHP